MSFIGYLKESVNIYQNIYESLSNSLLEEKDSFYKNISENYNKFEDIGESYSDIVDSQMICSSKIIPNGWNEYINVQNHGNSFFIIKITFNVDYPTINNYNIIVDETGIKKHYSFKQESDTSNEHKIKISSDINICFSDEIIDKIRNGEISKSGKIKFCYDNSSFPVLRIPFHKERIYLNNHFWIVSVLNSMDIEMSLIKNKYMSKDYNLFKKQKHKLSFNNIPTKTLYN